MGIRFDHRHLQNNILYGKLSPKGRVNMKKEHLSIGEFSYLSGLSIKALRYYDKIGILKPEYTDKKTSYRYYSRKQLNYSDIILTSIMLDIPLSYVKDNFIKEEKLDYEAYLSYADTVLKERIKILKERIDFVEERSEILSRQKKESFDSYTVFKSRKKTLLLLSFSFGIDTYEYEKKVADFFTENKAYEASFASNYGRLIYQEKNYFFIELKNPKFRPKEKDALLLSLEEGMYKGKLSYEPKKKDLPSSFALIMESILPGKTSYEIIVKE